MVRHLCLDGIDFLQGFRSARFLSQNGLQDFIALVRWCQRCTFGTVLSQRTQLRKFLAANGFIATLALTHFLRSFQNTQMVCIRRNIRASLAAHQMHDFAEKTA